MHSTPPRTTLMDTALIDPFQDQSHKQQRTAPSGKSPNSNAVDVFHEESVSSSVYDDHHQEELPYRYEPPTNPCARLFNRLIPHGGSLSGMVNLASCTLGASIISLPYAYRGSGMVIASVALASITAATVYAIHLLVKYGERTGLHSYEELARTLIGKKSDYLVAFLMFFFCFGTCTAYVIALGDVILPFLRGCGNEFFDSPWGNRTVVTLIWLVGMLPLSLQKEINSLRYFSFTAVCLIGFFVLVMTIHSIRFGFNESHAAAAKSFKGGIGVVEGLSLFMFAFLCQINTFEVYFEMHPRSVTRMTNDISVSMGICCILYVVAGTLGYFDFGDNTQDAILKNYDPRSDMSIAISFVGIAFKLCVGFSLCIQPARDAVFYACNMGEYHAVATWKRIAICSIMSVIALVLGLFIPAINIVFGLLGSLVGGLVGFAFPALFAMKAEENFSVATVGVMHFVCTWALLIAGIVAFVVGTLASVLDIAGVSSS